MSTEDTGYSAPAEQRPSSERLESWKEIAAYLTRGVRPVQRWEKEESLPVHRHLHEKLGTVYAYKPEVDAWWNNRRPRLDVPDRLVAAWRRLAMLAGAGVLLAGAVGALWWATGSFRRPQPEGGAEGLPPLSVRRVWADPNPELIAAISPDGRYLSTMDFETKGLAIVELATGHVRRLSNRESFGYPTYSAISPDGKRIAYDWFNEDFFFDLRVIGIDGQGAAVLSREPHVLVRPFEWSRDGREILALSSRKDRRSEIALVRASDGTIRVLKAFQGAAPSRVGYSSDERYVAYDFPADGIAGARDIYLLPADGGPEVPLVQHPSEDSVLGWVPDRKMLLFARERSGSADVWAVEVEGGKPQGAPQLVKENLGRVAVMGFARSGSYYYSVPAQFQEVFLVTLDPMSGRVLAPPAPAGPTLPTVPVWSPDGQALAYASQSPPDPLGVRQARIVIRLLSSGKERIVGTPLGQLGNLRWFPDGLAFVAEGMDRGGRAGLYRIDAQTGDSELLLERPSGSYVGVPMVAPGGRTLFYKRVDWSQKRYRIMARELGTGRERELLGTTAPVPVGLWEISPGGDDLAYMTSHLRSPIVIRDVGSPRRTETGELFRLKPGQEIGAFAWAARGDSLLIALGSRDRRPKTELWRVRLDGAEPENLGIEMDELRAVSVSPDGRHLALMTEKWKSEVWAMENFLPRPGTPRE